MTAECFYYGNRLKATLQGFKKYRDVETKSYLVKLYTHGKRVFKEKLFFNENKTESELFHEALIFARNYLNTCKY